MDTIGNDMHSPIVSYKPNVPSVKRFQMPSLREGNAQPHSYRKINDILEACVGF